LPGHTRFFLFLFFLQPGPVPAPGRPGLGSTRWAESGFKTMLLGVFYLSSYTCICIFFFCIL
jgi:hypothetical protein